MVEEGKAMEPWVKEAMRGLTKAQGRYVAAGCLHGDVTMRTARELQRKALFYFHPTSPNGRCGELRLTPLGESVQAILRARAALNKEPSHG